jgi:hypothetical protein
VDPGSEAVESLTFEVDSREYEIDLSEENAAKLREALAPFVEAARRAGGASSARRRQSAASPKRSRGDLAEVRAWLGEHGYPVKARGRIPEAWVADYDSKSPNPPQQGDRGSTEDKQPKGGSTVEAPQFLAV